MKVIPINLHQGFGLGTSLLHLFFDHGKLCVCVIAYNQKFYATAADPKKIWRLRGMMSRHHNAINHRTNFGALTLCVAQPSE